MSPTKWIESVNAIEIVSKAGRYGGTYAHSDIALEFASWDCLKYVRQLKEKNIAIVFEKDYITNFKTE